MNVVLLDRDGTVIKDPDDNRVDTIEKIQLFDDTIEALRHLADNDFSVIIVTNQAGIEEGLMSRDDFWRIHGEVVLLLEISEITVLKTYMNGEKAKPDASLWRKPGPNMILQAAEDFDLDVSQLYMIGDNDSDVQAAINAGCKGGILVETANETVLSPDAVCTAPRLMDAVRYVVANTSC